MASTADAKRAPGELDKAPTTEVGVDLIAAVPTWDVLGGALRGHSVDREEVSELRWPNSVRVFSRMRNDTQLSGLYRGTTLPIRRYVWGIDANGADQKVVDRICRHYNLQTIDKAWQAFLTGQSDPTPRRLNRFVFDRHSADAQRAIYVGHNYFELHGAVGEDGFWHPEDASPRSPWTIGQIFVAQNGDLVAIKQNVGLLSPELEAGRLVSYVFDQEPGDWTGRSMFRSCYREWLLKDRLLRVDLVNHEKAGGILINQAPPGATPAQMQALGALAASLQVGGGGSVPDGTTPIFIRGSGSDVIGSINRHDESMAREFLMMFMALGTSSSGGNRALAGSFLDWFAVSQEAIAIWQRDTFQRDVIDRDVFWNDGEPDYVPQLVFKRPEAANPLDKLAATVTTADQAGVPGAIGIQQGDQVVPVAAVRYGKGGAMTLVPKVVVDGDAYDEIVTAHDEFEQWARPRPRAVRSGRNAHPAAASQDALPLPARTLRREPYQHEVAAAVNFAQLDADWQSTLDQLVAAWKTVRTGQIAELAQAIQDAGGSLDTLASLAATPAGADLIAAHLKAAASAGAVQALAEARAQGLAAPAEADLALVNDELENRAGALEQLLARSLSEAAARKSVAITGGTLTAAEVAGETSSYLEGLTDAYLNDQFGGATTAAQNAGRRAVMAANQASRVYASELLDSNTCEPCRAVDGTEFASLEDAASEYPSGGFKDCQGGPRCRGTLVAVYDEAPATASREIAALEDRNRQLAAALERPVELHADLHIHDGRTIEVPVDVHVHEAAQEPMQLSFEEGAIATEVHVDAPQRTRPRKAVARRGADGGLEVDYSNGTRATGKRLPDGSLEVTYHDGGDT